MERATKTIIFLPLILIFLLIAAFVVSPIINNIRLNRFAKQLESCPLPQKTEIVEKKKECGKLSGCGNGMDFFACILIKSDLSLSELNQYYCGKPFKPAKAFSKHDVQIKIIEPKGKTLKSQFVERPTINFDSLKNKKDFSKYYIVMIYDGGYSAGFDLRGN